MEQSKACCCYTADLCHGVVLCPLHSRSVSSCGALRTVQIAVRSEEPYRLQAYTVLRGLAGTDARTNPDAAGQSLCAGSHADAALSQVCPVIASRFYCDYPAFMSGALCDWRMLLGKRRTFLVLPSFSLEMLLLPLS